MDLTRKDSDEWLCSSSHQPKIEEIQRRNGEVAKKKRKTSKIGQSSSTSTRRSTVPATPQRPVKIKKIALKLPPKIVKRKSPSEIFAQLTPKRQKSLLSFGEHTTEEQAEEEQSTQKSEDPFDSDASDVSNVFEDLSPVKKHAPFEVDFVLGSQFVAPAKDDDFVGFAVPALPHNNRPPLIRDVEFELNEIEESCAYPVLPSMMMMTTTRNNYHIDDEETQNKSVYHMNTSKIEIVEEETKIENVDDVTQTCSNSYKPMLEMVNRRDSGGGGTRSQLSLETNLIDRNSLTGLAAKFASLMSSKINERRVEMNDLVLGTKKMELQSFEATRGASGFGLSTYSLTAFKTQQQKEEEEQQGFLLISRTNSATVARLCSSSASRLIVRIPCWSLSPPQKKQGSAHFMVNLKTTKKKKKKVKKELELELEQKSILLEPVVICNSI